MSNKQELNKIDTEKELDPYYLRCLGQDIENFEDYANIKNIKT